MARSFGTPTALGTAATRSSTSLVVTTGATANAGDTIFVAVGYLTSPNTPTDSAGNTYTLLATSTYLNVYVCYNSKGLASGGTVTTTGTNIEAVSVWSIASMFSYDLITSTTSSGSSTTPSATVNTGIYTGSQYLVFGIVGDNGPGTDTFTQATGWTSVPTTIGSTGGSAAQNVTIIGGYQLTGNVSSYTYAPTLGTSRAWSEILIIFKQPQILYSTGVSPINWDPGLTTTANTKWSNISNGTANAAPPNAGDDVIFNITGGGAIISNSNVWLSNLILSGTSTSITANISPSTINVYGNITNTTTNSKTIGNSNIVIWSSNCYINEVIGSLISVSAPFYVTPGSDFTINNSFTTSNTFTFASNGNLTLNGYRLSANSFSMTGTSPTINVTSGNILVGGNSKTIVNISSNTLNVNGTLNLFLQTAASTGTRTILLNNLPESESINIAVQSGTDSITFTSGDTVGTLNFTGFSGTWVNTPLTIYRGLTTSATMTVGSGSNTITFANTTAATNTITSGGKLYDFPVTVNAPSSTYTLGAALAVGPTRTTTLTAGNLYLSTFSLTTGSFVSSNTNNRQITFATGSYITANASGNIIDITDTTNLTINGTDPRIYANNNSATAAAISIGPYTANPISVNVATGSYGLTLYGGSVNNLFFTGFTGSLTSGLINIYGNLSLSTGMTINSSANAITLADTGFQSITSSGVTIATPLIANGTAQTITLVDTLSTSSTVNLGSGTTLTLNRNWTSTGSVVNGLAINQTANTWTSSGAISGAGTVTQSTGAAWTHSTNPYTGTGAISISGIWTNQSGGTVSGPSTITVANTWNANATINAGAITLTSGNINMNADITGTGAFTYTAGNLNITGNILTAASFTSNTTTTRNLNFGTTGNLIITGSGAHLLVGNTGLTLSGTPTITLNNTTSTAATANLNYITNPPTFNVIGGSYPLTLVSYTLNNLIFSGFTGSWAPGNITVMNGNVTLSSGMTFNSTSNKLSFVNTSANPQGITSNGVQVNGPISLDGASTVFYTNDAFNSSANMAVPTGTTLNTSLSFNVPNIYVSGGAWNAGGLNTISGPVTLSSGNINMSSNIVSSDIFTVTSGNLNINARTVQANVFTSNNSNTRTLNFSGGNIILTGNNTTIFDISNQTGLTTVGIANIYANNNATTGTRTVAVSNMSESLTLSFNISNGSDTFSFTSGDNVDTVNFTGFNGTWSNQQIEIFGGLTLVSGMTVGSGTGLVTFAATSGTYSITSNTKTMDFPVTFDGIGGTWQLSDKMTVGSSRTTTLTNGTVNLNNTGLQTGNFNSTNTNNRTLAFGTSGYISASGTGSIIDLTDTTNLTTTGTPLFYANNNTSTAAYINVGTLSSNPSFYIGTGSYPLTLATDNIKDLTFNTFTGTFDAYPYNIYGNVSLSNMAYTTDIGNTWTFTSGGSQSITSGSETFTNQINLATSGTTITLRDAFITTANLNIPANTTLNTGFAFTTSAYVNSSGTLSISATTNNGTINQTSGTLSSNGAISGSGSVYQTGGTWTASAGAYTATGTITIGGIWTNSGTATVSGPSLVTVTGSWNQNATASATALTLSGGNINQGAALTATGTATLNSGNLNLSNNSLTAAAFSSNNANTRVINFGTSGYVSVTGTGLSFDITDVTNLTFAGTPRLYANINSSTSSKLSMGSYTTNPINANIAAGNYPITLNIPVINNLDFTGFTGSWSPSVCILYGNLKLGTGMTISSSENTITFAKNGSQDITSSGVTLDSLIAANGTGQTLTLGDALNTTLDVTLGSGTTLALSKNWTTSGRVVNGLSINQTAGTWTSSGAISGAGSITQSSGATWTHSTRPYTGTGAISIGGTWTNQNNGTVSGPSSIAVTGTWNANAYVTSGAVTLTSGNINMNGNIASSGVLTLTSGNINVNNSNLSATSFNSNNSNTRTLNFINGNLTLTNSGTVFDLTTATGFSSTGSGNIILSSASGKTFIGGGATYGATLVQGGAGNLTITGTNTFNNLQNTSSSATYILLPSSVTTTFTQNFNVAGKPGALLNLVPSTPATVYTLRLTSSNTAKSNFLNISYSNVYGGGSSVWYAGGDSINGTNNTGWTFTNGNSISISTGVRIPGGIRIF